MVYLEDPLVIPPKSPAKPIKVQPRPTKIFRVHGVEIEAYSKKDALKRYNHRYK